MDVYCVKYESYAGKWIYDGYRNAWNSLGFTVKDLRQLNEASSDYYLMTTDSWVTKDNIKYLEKANKVFLYVQPNVFPSPWGTHPNFVSTASKEIVKRINALDNVIMWSFADIKTEYYPDWSGQIHTVPLAFDTISYSHVRNAGEYIFDVCYIGGWANNGFDEKKRIMLDVFSEFKKTNLKCGFFINRNVSHEQEQKIISNSKVCLNIHDAYQRVLGLDTNERTFKSLGLNGLLVSDKIDQLNEIFPNVKTSNSSKKIVEYVAEYAKMEHNDIQKIKNKNKQQVLKEHCYTNRIKYLLGV